MPQMQSQLEANVQHYRTYVEQKKAANEKPAFTVENMLRELAEALDDLQFVQREYLSCQARLKMVAIGAAYYANLDRLENWLLFSFGLFSFALELGGLTLRTPDGVGLTVPFYHHAGLLMGATAISVSLFTVDKYETAFNNFIQLHYSRCMSCFFMANVCLCFLYFRMVMMGLIVYDDLASAENKFIESDAGQPDDQILANMDDGMFGAAIGGPGQEPGEKGKKGKLFNSY
ncbi:unnamed protein product [Dibothriocephalus latus]|uniref:Uncharacterized protein n=1 Tax=Dibothriocephalus latus TaxID=60516 RepID=A0A3P7NW42_DIBLA|nr:unnamed protein product [Dibothriocephalus latus]